MFYNVSILDYHGRECEVRIFESPVANNGVRCDDYGVILERYERWIEDDWCPFVDGFDESEIVDGMVKVHDIDEVERKAKRSAQSSLSRTKSRVYQLARGNSWMWFITFTFSPKQVDRYNWDIVTCLMRDWLYNQRRKHERHGYELIYMVVPEQHKDGAWHFHGIFGGCSDELLEMRYSNHGDVYNVDSWTWGFSTATVVQDELSVSNYITKYFTKDIIHLTKGKKRYWASRNLKVPERCNLSVRAKDESGVRRSIELALLDDVSYTSVVTGPAGTVTYLQCKSSAAEVIDSLCNANVVIEEAELCGAGS